jgi:hypothetical protein
VPAYNKNRDQYNSQLEFDFTVQPNGRPTDLAVHRLAAATGMSSARARATLEALEPHRD